jgi:hypothetical protein
MQLKLTNIASQLHVMIVETDAEIKYFVQKKHVRTINKFNKLRTDRAEINLKRFIVRLIMFSFAS